MSDRFKIKSYQCKDCIIKGCRVEGDDLIFNCLNGFSRVEIRFVGTKNNTPDRIVLDRKIHRVEQREIANGYKCFCIFLYDEYDSIDIVARDMVYAE
jgi:hypothetical protein